MSDLAKSPLFTIPSKRNRILASGNEIPVLQADKLAFPKIVENAANAVGDTVDTNLTSKRLESIKEHFENLKTAFLNVNTNNSFISYLGSDAPFAEFSTEKENDNSNVDETTIKKMEETKKALSKEQLILRQVEEETIKARTTLNATTKDLFDAYRLTKRKFQETENILGNMLLKKQKLSTNATKILNKITTNNNYVEVIMADKNAVTIEGCQAILNVQTQSMQNLGEEEVKLHQILSDLEKKLQPLKQEIETLQAIVDGGEEEEQDFKEELQSIRDANKHMESMKLWYTNVMGFAQTIQGVTLDINMEKIHEPDSWKHSFGKDQINLKLIDDTVKHTLKLKFEPNSSKLKNCELIPADIPIDDILSASKSLGNETTSEVTKNDSIKMLIREIRMRLQAKRKREQEVVELKQMYPAVRIVFKKDSSQGGVSKESLQPETSFASDNNSITTAAQFLNVHVTIASAIVVCMEMDPDYPLPYTRPYVTELVGVMGWKDDDINQITEKVRNAKKKSMKEVVQYVEELANGFKSSNVAGSK
eukprot:g7054.t1